MALFAIAIMAVAALPTAHALYGNKNLWITPFKTGSCQNCPAVVLPWCIKVPAQNIVCPVPTHYGIASADVPLPSCLTFKADQLDGQVPAQQIQGPIPGMMAFPSQTYNVLDYMIKYHLPTNKELSIQGFSFSLFLYTFHIDFIFTCSMYSYRLGW